MAMVSFKVVGEEVDLIHDIAKRAIALAEKHGLIYTLPDAEMDITACHANGCRLELKKLLDAPDGEFGHDVFGIRRHLDRTNGKLMNSFLPRCGEKDRKDPKLFDVVSVSVRTRKVTGLMAEGKTERNAEAVIKMAIMRRGLKGHFYADVPAGKYKVGDKFEDEKAGPR